MKISAIRSVLFATTFAVAGCGGGGGYVASTPPVPVTPTPTPTPTPAPAPAIIAAATTSQQFAAVGATYPIDDDHTPLLSPSDQLQVRYVASSNTYEVQIPHSQNWVASTYSSSGPGMVVYQGGVGGATMWVRTGPYQYSTLLEWSDGDNVGHEAIGMATPAGGVPVTGSATYSGKIFGVTSEYQAKLADDFDVDGSILLSFNFGAGSLSGSISPNLHQGYDFAPLNFVSTVYSTGSTTFSGKFNTSAAGVNSFSGLFTGPTAQELIGNFAFPYVSPVDSKTYQASGAFVGKK